jgi:hypothetical protein
MDASYGKHFVSATHEALFATEPTRCDACGALLGESADEDEGYAVSGSGLYVSTRGSEVRYEEPPLCPSCAAAVGMSALARWEIEEEEG